MKIRVLYPTVFQHMDPAPEAGDVVTVSDDEAAERFAAGSAEPVKPKVERATKAPGERKSVTRKKGDE